MKPYVICHMASSIDGRTLLPRWQPETDLSAEFFEKFHKSFGINAWLVGRATGQEYATLEAYPERTVDSPIPRISWLPNAQSQGWAIILDPHGKIAFGRSEIDGEQVLVVLTEAVTDSHLANLRSDGVSYLFAGSDELDILLLMDQLGELGIQRLLLEGGGSTNGQFLAHGLVDEVSVLHFPSVDGSPGAPAIFDLPKDTSCRPITSISLSSVERIENDVVWLKYKLSYQ